jgi:hypothetical protein
VWLQRRYGQGLPSEHSLPEVLRQLDRVLERRAVHLELVRLQWRQHPALSPQYQLSQGVLAVGSCAVARRAHPC